MAGTEKRNERVEWRALAEECERLRDACKRWRVRAEHLEYGYKKKSDHFRSTTYAHYNADRGLRAECDRLAAVTAAWRRVGSEAQKDTEERSKALLLLSKEIDQDRRSYKNHIACCKQENDRLREALETAKADIRKLVKSIS